MADTTEIDDTESPKKSKLPIIIGLVTTLIGAGAGLFIAKSGLLNSSNAEPVIEEAQNQTAPSATIANLAFVPLDPIIVSFSEGENRRLLRFVGSLEVSPDAVDEVEILKPRITDILNGYLRALELEDFEEPAALLRIRSQLLHRVMIVAGEDRIRDLLIIEFVIN